MKKGYSKLELDREIEHIAGMDRKETLHIPGMDKMELIIDWDKS